MLNLKPLLPGWDRHKSSLSLQWQNRKGSDKMKALVALVGLSTVSLHSGETAVAVTIRAYNTTGEVALGQDSVLLGTRLILTCDVEGLPEGKVVISYKWYHSCSTGRCEIREEDPYYTVVNDNLLVDATSWESRPRRHTCEVKYQSDEGGSATKSGFTTLVSLTDSSATLAYTPTSFLLNHALITDVLQITGRNGQQWIKCTKGRDTGRVNIYTAADSAIVSSSLGTVEIGPDRNPSNALYYCSAARSQKYYFSIFINKLRNSSYLPTPTVSAQDSSMWTLTSPDGTRVERYIVEFECRVRNITFVEKYMSVSASGGTGQVATSVSCFGGLGQLYRVKVWAVSGPNISRGPAVKCLTPDGQCMMEVGVDGDTVTTQALISTPTTAGASTRNISYSTPNGTQGFSPEQAEGGQAEIVTFIGVGIGIGMLLLIVVLALVGVIVAVVMVKRRAANKKMGSLKMKENPSNYNPVVVEMQVKGLGYDYEDVHKDKTNGSVVDGFYPYEDVDSKTQMKNRKKPAAKESSTPASANNVGELYAVVDKSKKGVKQKQDKNGRSDTNKVDLYTVPINKSKMKNGDKGIVATGSVVKSEDYDDVADLNYEPKADSEPGQQCKGDSEFPNADMLYAVVDKGRKKKK